MADDPGQADESEELSALVEVLELDENTYQHLRAIAGLIHSERAGKFESIQPTALMHEAWMKAARGKYNSKAHFMAVAARAMRQILVSRVRARMADKRGGGMQQVTLSGLAQDGPPLEILALDEALEQLKELKPRTARIVTMHTFGGMTMDEIAEVEGLSKRSVLRDWRFARAFLNKTLSE